MADNVGRVEQRNSVQTTTSYQDKENRQPRSLQKKALLFTVLAGMGSVRESVHSENVGSGLVPTQVAKLVCKGNPKNGTVTYIKQLHKFPGLNAEAMAEVEKSQKNILDVLFEMSPKHVFTESRSVPLKAPKSNSPEKTDEDIKSLKAAFKDYKPGNPLSKEQAIELMKKDASETYLHLAHNVTLHATTTEAAQRAIQKHFFDNWNRLMAPPGIPGTFNKKDIEVIITGREKLTLEKIKTFLASFPEEKVALIYGGAHNFQQHCGKDGFISDMFEYDSSPQTVWMRT